ncbi:MAG: LysR family transcriptional regulator [Candidatus Lokiarchaeota archaeon]|nr:LysR family transcriptional regulator [Candidatus Harpocratesius repetitus]
MSSSPSLLNSIRSLRIEHFLTLNELIKTRSFSQTARNLGITQGAISHRLKDLEHALGNLELLTRTSRYLSINPEGLIVKKFSEKLEEQLLELQLKIQEANKTPQINITIASSSIPGEYLLPKLFMHFQNKYPNLIFQIHISNTKCSISELLNGKTNFCAVGNLDHVNLSEIDYKEIGQDKILIIAKKNHPIFSSLQKIKNKIDYPQVFSHLLKYPWVLRELGSATREIFFREFKYSSKIQVGLELHNNTAIIHAVENSNALSAISSFALESLGREANVQPVRHIALKKIQRNLYIVKKKEKRLNPHEKDFWNFTSTF